MADSTGRSPELTRELLRTERTAESPLGLDRQTAGEFARRIEIHLWHGNYGMARKVLDLAEKCAMEREADVPLEQWSLTDAGCEAHVAGVLDNQGVNCVGDLLGLSFDEVCKLQFIGHGKQAIYVWGFIEEVRECIRERDGGSRGR